jgi:hypothetical protein
MVILKVSISLFSLKDHPKMQLVSERYIRISGGSTMQVEDTAL